MNAIDVIVEASQRTMNARMAGKRPTVEVPEWGYSQNGPMVIYVKLPNGRATDMVAKYAREAQGSVSVGFSASYIVAHAYTLLGEPLFQPADIDQLLDNADPEVVKSVALQISKVIAETWPELDEDNVQDTVDGDTEAPEQPENESQNDAVDTDANTTTAPVV